MAGVSSPETRLVIALVAIPGVESSVKNAGGSSCPIWPVEFTTSEVCVNAGAKARALPSSSGAPSTKKRKRVAQVIRYSSPFEGAPPP